MDAAVAEVDAGATLKSVSAKYKIPYTTLQNHSKGRYRDYDTSFGREDSVSAEDEAALVDYLVYMAERGYPLTRKILKQYVIEIVKRSGNHNNMNLEKGPSDKWLRKFLKKNPKLSMRSPHGIDPGHRTVGQDEFDRFYDLLEDELKVINNDPSRIFNMDETGFSSRSKSNPSKVIAPRGCRQAFSIKLNISGHVTLVATISADGRILPPKIIFSSKSATVPDADNDELGIPGDWVLVSTPTGFIVEDELVSWLVETFLPSIGCRRPVLLILDNHSTHLTLRFLDLCKENNVRLLFLPSKTSLKLQPLDVGFFHIFKQRAEEHIKNLGFAGAVELPRSQLPKIIYASFLEISAKTVASSFSATGIFPFTRKVKAFAQGTNDNEVEEDTFCASCHQVIQPNILVRTGIVPPRLQDILLPPPPPKRKHQRKTMSARVVSCDSQNDTPQQTAGPSQPSVEPPRPDTPQTTADPPRRP